jgi:hypothetical protein
MKEWMGRIGLFGLVGACIFGSSIAGCAGERDPINRVQQGVVQKSFFLGENLEDHRDDPEFRTKSFNIDSGANVENASGTIGGATAVDRVRWEVTEGMLFARRSYQESPGADNRGLPRVEVAPGKWEFPTKPTGTIVAAYKILSHFDIRREYNPSTGEEQNTIVENTSDRPWYSREYMRVDWSMNLAESSSGDTSWVFGAGSTATAIQYSPTNDNDEDRPHFENGYFDITSKYQLKSQELPGFGVSECVLLGFFNGSSSFDCTPTEVKFRSSFVRLDGTEDFEPFEESRASRDIVGNWGNAGNNFNREYGAAPITAWDPQYGYTDAKTKTFFAMHNIWEKSHQSAACTSNEDTDGDGTADACANTKTGYKGSTGSQCDVHVGKCTLPVRDREVKTVGYWLNAETPKELTDEVSADGKTITKPGPIEEMTITWNQLLRNAVATRREVECRRTKSGDRDTCHTQFFDGQGPEGKEMVAFGGWGIDKAKALPVDKGKPVIATCHNPVRAYDPEACGKPGEATRLGDLRKNYTIYWPYASRAPYGGVASIGADPLTGEMLGATATIMGRSATAAAAQQRDIIQLAIGDTTIDDLVQGGQAERYADLIKNGRVNEAMARGKTADEHREIAGRVDQAPIKATLGQEAARLDALGQVDRSLARAKMRAQDSLLSPRITADNQRVDGLLGKLDGSPLKADISDKNLQQLVAQSKDKQSSVYRSLEAFAKNDSGKTQDLFERYEAYLGNKGICFHDSAASAGAGSIYQAALAPYFKKKYEGLDPKARGVAIYNELLREAVKGIGFHEIGHSIGMRHNFASSWDAMNFSPQYWQLRTAEGSATGKCADTGRNGPTDTCMGPRYLDPVTADEQGLDPNEPRPGIEYFANTSTMEYQIERFGETVGAGTYDLHFMKTIYGRVLETMDERQIAPEQQQYFGLKTLSQGIPSNLVFVPSSGYEAGQPRQGLRPEPRLPTCDRRREGDGEVAYRPRQDLLALAEEPPRVRGHEIFGDRLHRQEGRQHPRRRRRSEVVRHRREWQSPRTLALPLRRGLQPRRVHPREALRQRRRRLRDDRQHDSSLRPHLPVDLLPAPEQGVRVVVRPERGRGQHVRPPARLPLEHDDGHRPRGPHGPHEPRPGSAGGVRLERDVRLLPARRAHARARYLRPVARHDAPHPEAGERAHHLRPHDGHQERRQHRGDRPRRRPLRADRLRQRARRQLGLPALPRPHRLRRREDPRAPRDGRLPPDALDDLPRERPRRP